MKKTIAILNTILLVLYWIPVLVSLVMKYDPEAFLSGLTLLMISLAVTSVLAGGFAVVEVFGTSKSSTVIALLTVLLVKHLIDLAYFQDMLFVYIAIFFLITILSVKFMSLRLSVQNHVFILNILLFAYSVIFIVENGWPWEVY